MLVLKPEPENYFACYIELYFFFLFPCRQAGTCLDFEVKTSVHTTSTNSYKMLSLLQIVHLFIRVRL